MKERIMMWDTRFGCWGRRRLTDRNRISTSWIMSMTYQHQGRVYNRLRLVWVFTSVFPRSTLFPKILINPLTYLWWYVPGLVLILLEWQRLFPKLKFSFLPFRVMHVCVYGKYLIPPCRYEYTQHFNDIHFITHTHRIAVITARSP